MNNTINVKTVDGAARHQLDVSNSTLINDSVVEIIAVDNPLLELFPILLLLFTLFPKLSSLVDRNSTQKNTEINLNTTLETKLNETEKNLFQGREKWGEIKEAVEKLRNKAKFKREKKQSPLQAWYVQRGIFVEALWNKTQRQEQPIFLEEAKVSSDSLSNFTLKN